MEGREGRIFTREEVRAESSTSKCLLIVGEKVFDATAFSATHPGGETLV